MDKIEFGQWLQAEREKRGLTQSELARLSGLHRQIINKTENGVSMPAAETYVALSNALGLSPIVLFRKAGLLPDAPTDQVRLEDWEYLLNQLSPSDQEEMRQIAQMKIERNRAAEALARANNHKLRPSEK